MSGAQRWLVGVCVAASVGVPRVPPAAAAEPAPAIPNEMGGARGVAVVLGDATCALAIELARISELLVYVQLDQHADVEQARRAADAGGLYGKRVYIDQGGLARLHLADNTVDVLVAVGDAAGVPEAEVLRVLAPRGKARLGAREIVKLLPEGIDDWSHPYHGPDNNPQSKDLVARAPYLTQFFAHPRYGPSPQVAVASAGRVFKAFGNVAWHEREEPFLNTLAAFNGYNGTLLWRRPLAPGVLIHRNTLIATPTVLYLGDDRSCKVLDAATGRLLDEIAPPVEVAGGTFWKWMALQDGVLYALLGEPEESEAERRWKRLEHGWPWDEISKGYNDPEHNWGFGRTVLAIDPATKRVLWHCREEEPADGRAVCMKNGRIYLLRFGSYLTCLDARTGQVVWRKSRADTPALFETIGPYLNRQGWETNWRSVTYLKCSDRVLYVAGPQVSKLVAISTEDGRVLWTHPYDNFQLVLREDGLYGISGEWTSNASRKFDPLSGQVLAELNVGRRGCTRVTGAVDALFYRAMDGSVRFDVASGRPGWISPMRPSCHDGVTIANGLLYWSPWACDCQLTIYGFTALGPAGGFDFTAQATEAQRLERGAAGPAEAVDLPVSSADWPTFRANNQRTAVTSAIVPEKGWPLWDYAPEKTGPTRTPTAPVAADGLVFLGGSDGIVRALDAATGRPAWKAYTGGEIRLPPTIWNGRALVGSGDGWVYAFEARSGRLLWRFRAAPAERWIPVYGGLLSTWPAASGVLVENGIAYVAAGIVNYDGTYVYALDAATGGIKWQNNTSGHLDPQARTGVSVQGHLLLHDGRLYLAGGNAVSPAVYDASNGQCLNDPQPLKRCESTSPRGSELFLIADEVVACGKPLYTDPAYPVYDDTVTRKILVASTADHDVIWLDDRKVMCFSRLDRQLLRNCLSPKLKKGSYRIPTWGEFKVPDKPLWEYGEGAERALAVCTNAVVVAGAKEIVVLNLADGRKLWAQPLPAPPVPWGLAVDRDGRVAVALEDGRVLCFGQGT